MLKSMEGNDIRGKETEKQSVAVTDIPTELHKRKREAKKKSDE